MDYLTLKTLVVVVSLSLQVVQNADIDVTKSCFEKQYLQLLSTPLPSCQVTYSIFYGQRCVQNSGLFIALDDDTNSEQDVFITCTAPYPLEVDVDVDPTAFLRFDEKEHITIVSERQNLGQCENCTSLHKITLPVMTTESKGAYTFKALRRYRIREAGSVTNGKTVDNEKFSLHFMIIGAGNFVFSLSKRRTHLMSPTATISCLYDYSGGIKQLQVSTFANGTSHKLVDLDSRPFTDVYDPFYGMRFNVSRTPHLYRENAEYSCYGEAPSVNPSLIGPARQTNIFGLDYVTGLFIEPKTVTVECYNFPCKIYCEYDEPVMLSVVDEGEKKKELVKGKLLFRTYENVTRYGTQFLFDSSDDDGDKFSVVCLREKDNSILHIWQVLKTDILDPKPEQTLKLEIPNSLESNVNAEMVLIRCHSRNLNVSINRFFSLSCNNWMECNFYKDSKCVWDEDGFKKWKNNFLEDPGNCGPPILKPRNCSDSERKGNSCMEVQLKLNDTGFLLCSAQNGATFASTYFIGFDHKLYFYENGMPKPSFPPSSVIKISNSANKDEPLFSSKSYWFSCESHYFVTEHGLEWKIRWKNGTTTLAVTTGEDKTRKKEVWESDVNPNRKSLVLLEDHDVSGVICAAPLIGSNDWIEKSLDVEITRSTKPVIDAPKYIYIEKEGSGSIECKADGEPKPQVNWLINDNLFQELPPEKRPNVHVNEQSATLTFPYFSESLAGDYVCWASNGIYSTNQTSTVAIATKNWTGVIIAGSVAIILVLLVVLYIVYRNWRATQVALQRISEDELDEFLHGIRGNANESDYYRFTFPALTVPYDTSYEIKKENLYIDTEAHLGSGQFGTVYKAQIELSKESQPAQSKLTAAVKTIKSDSCKPQDLKNLLNEIKLMIYLGKHENLVELLGACTKNCRRGELYVVMEYCQMGSLQSYLEKNRERWSLILEAQQPDEKGDGNGKDAVLKKLYRWSFEIANGMDYIASKNMIHGDLAIRNCLLQRRTADYQEIVKISDFGLSRKLYDYAHYVKTNQEPLPWRWLSLEAIRQLKFSTKSDIWAYGITVWEVFTLGDVPYPGLSFNPEFLELLERGFRNSKPKYATDACFEIMKRCWRKEPGSRPNFLELKTFFQDQSNISLEDKEKRLDNDYTNTTSI